MRWLAAGFLLIFASSFGQTFFIALFGGELRAAFDLSHGEFGGLYTMATLASAITLLWLGRLADQGRLRPLALMVLVGLAAASLAMANVNSWFMLVAVLFGLRLFGQGLLTHLAMTAMARWFDSHRGRALSIASLGFPAGEAVLPALAVLSIGLIGWRQTWVLAALTLLLVAAPLLFWLLRREPSVIEERGPASGATTSATARQHWTQGEILRDPRFYALMPGVLAPSFIGTSIFFHQVHLTAIKGWSLGWFAACYPIYALATVCAALVVGWAVDRWCAVRLLPFYLLPMTFGLIALGASDAPAVAVVFMVLAGITSAAAATLLGALWAELYGTRHLGAIRGVVVAGMVLSSALGPGVVGALIDAGIGLDGQFWVMAVFTLGASSLFRLLQPKLSYSIAA